MSGVRQTQRLTLPLDTSTIRRLLSGSHFSHFLGVFAIDQLPSILPKHSDNTSHYCFIVNTDPSHLPGKHWIAVWFSGKQGEVFDSYGRPPPARLQCWLTKHCRHWTYCKRFIQGPLTMLCGVYCIFMLHRRCTNTANLNFKQIVDLEFGEIASLNDDKMQKFLLTLN